MAAKLLCCWGLVSRAPSILSFCWSFHHLLKFAEISSFLIFVSLVLWTLQEKSSYDFFLFFLAIVSSFPLFCPWNFHCRQKEFLWNNWYILYDFTSLFLYLWKQGKLLKLRFKFIYWVLWNCLNAVWCSFFLLQCLIQLYFKSPFIDIRFVLFYECPFCLDRGSVFLNLIKIINQTCFKNSLFFVE